MSLRFHWEWSKNFIMIYIIEIYELDVFVLCIFIQTSIIALGVVGELSGSGNDIVEWFIHRSVQTCIGIYPHDPYGI